MGQNGLIEKKVFAGWPAEQLGWAGGDVGHELGEITVHFGRVVRCHGGACGGERPEPSRARPQPKRNKGDGDDRGGESG